MFKIIYSTFILFMLISLTLEQQNLKIYSVTWNMGGKEPTKNDISDLFTLDERLDKNPAEYDLYVIGTQECLTSIMKSIFYSNKNAWERAVG